MKRRVFKTGFHFTGIAVSYDRNGGVICAGLLSQNTQFVGIQTTSAANGSGWGSLMSNLRAGERNGVRPYAQFIEKPDTGGIYCQDRVK